MADGALATHGVKYFLKKRHSHGTIIRVRHYCCDGPSPSPPKPLGPSYSKPTVRAAFSLPLADRKVGFFFATWDRKVG
ncbi:hypothetical protein, partial [Mesorhizobium sp. M7A.F.Ca.AU.001.01.1.1]|uniref:hypothetical protein n=1 Tax=Mesorhizobium sp. M7A.F.Ca.AU.001.01.1.1 TaxID=2496675 RepID=UPI0019D44174